MTTTTTTRSADFTGNSTPCLYVAFELSWNEWRLAFTVGAGQAPRLRRVAARDTAAVLDEIARAKDRFGLPAETPVRSCYEAGRDGFWLHRWLVSVGIDNVIVDSASIEVNRRQRRAKSDSLDAGKLVTMLCRYHGGEAKVWKIVSVPTPAEEDLRQLHRDLMSLKDERTAHVNRLKGLLANHGLAVATIDAKFPETLDRLRLWDGSALGADLKARLLRGFERWKLVDRQIKDLEIERRQRIRCDETPHVEKVRTLLNLNGIGLNGAWLLVMELFAWRTIVNRKQLGSLVGLTPTPFQSGESSREQGISKAGNRRLRKMMVELAWCWVRWHRNRHRNGKHDRHQKGKRRPEYLSTGGATAGAAGRAALGWLVGPCRTERTVAQRQERSGARPHEPSPIAVAATRLAICRRRRVKGDPSPN